MSSAEWRPFRLGLNVLKRRRSGSTLNPVMACRRFPTKPLWTKYDSLLIETQFNGT